MLYASLQDEVEVSGSIKVNKVAVSSSSALVNYRDEEEDEDEGEIVPLQEMVEADGERKQMTEKIQLVQQVTSCLSMIYVVKVPKTKTKSYGDRAFKNCCSKTFKQTSPVDLNFMPSF